MSKIEVNAVEPQCGTTLTLGASGDTVTLGSGASQTGFGRAGTVDWDTTPKTANFTAVSGTGYFVNTTSGAVTMTMPSGSAGAIVSIQDYNKTFDTNNLTVTPASGEKINGGSADGILVISTEGQGLTFVYVDSTVGWKTVHENEFTSGGVVEIIATGGTITTCGNCKIHTFTGPGTFCVSQISSTPANNVISYVVVAGGGGGSGGPSGDGGGGGGAGGFREYKSPVTPYTASPLNGNPGGTSITLTAQAYPITVGSGGTGTAVFRTVGGSGANSVFSTVTSAGGGGGGANTTSAVAGGSGGGGGGGGGGPTCASPTGGPSFPGGAGNTPPVTPSQGNNGGIGGNMGGTGDQRAAGGGGATAAGQNSQAPNEGGDGGAGATSSITGSPVARAGGGGGMSSPASSQPAPAGGTGGGGVGGICGAAAGAGTDNTGGGGGGAGGGGPPDSGGNGGSGIVIIRYKFQ